MAIKKTHFKDDEIAIYDDAVIYKRGEYWQFRMWLEKEGKYARFSLKTRSQSTAEANAKQQFHMLMSAQQQGKTYFSLTTKAGVEMFIAYKQKEVGTGITRGRLTTIKTHLQHWLNFIKKDTKLKELARTDCEDYFLSRTKTNKKLPASQTTVSNEQSTINAMMKYLFRHNETNIDGFDFRKLPRLDTNNEALRRSTFTAEEAQEFDNAIHQYVSDVKNNLEDDENLIKFACSYYFLFAMQSGLRTGEQRQLKWSDLSWHEHTDENDGVGISIVELRIRQETSKWGKSRKFEIRDKGYLEDYRRKIWGKHNANGIANSYVFSKDGENMLSARALGYHFKQILDLTNIKDKDKRDIVPYSLRHFFITQKVISGVNILQIAADAGTSPTHIHKTYYHTDNATRRNSALAGYKVSDSGNSVIEDEQYE